MSSSAKSFQFPEVRVVEASAGSGKTLVLANGTFSFCFIRPQPTIFLLQRYLFGTITFTNKAAFEMKALKELNKCVSQK